MESIKEEIEKLKKEKREKGRYTGPLLCARRGSGNRRLYRRFLFPE